MRAYIIRRLLLVVPTLFILSVLVFLSVRFIPGDVIDIMAGRTAFVGGQVDRATIEQRLGLDLPIPVQYGRWIGGILLRGTLGESLLGGWRIEERMLGRLPVTAELGLLAILIGLVIALPVGIYSAIRQYTAADYVGRSVAIMGLATPNFWLGTMVMIYPAIWWAWSPPMELVPFARGPAGQPRHVPHPQPDPGHLPVGQHHAHDAHHDAGGAAPGLHQDRLGQRVCWSGR